jgi:hypothetical protein
MTDNLPVTASLSFNQLSDFKTVFDAWAERFDALALDLHNKHEAWKNAYVLNEKQESAPRVQKAAKAWDDAEEIIQKHFFGRYQNTTQFWGDFFKSLDQTFPVVKGFENNAESSKLYYMQLVSNNYESTAKTCRPLDMMHLNHMVHFHLKEILFERGYTQSDDPKGKRVKVKILNKPLFKL